MPAQRFDGDRTALTSTFDLTEGEASLRDRVMALLRADGDDRYSERRTIMGLEAFDRVEI